MQQVGQNLFATDPDNTNLLDFQASRHVGQAAQSCRFDSGSHSQAEHRQDHVTGTRDIINFANPCRQVNRFCIPAGQDDAIAIKRHEGHLQREFLDEQVSCLTGGVDRTDLDPRGLEGFGSIRRDAGCAAIEIVIAPGRRIDDDR